MSEIEAMQRRLDEYDEALWLARQERDEARKKASEWHRRAQKAEAVVAKGVEKQVGLRNRANVGRALANVMAWHYKEEADRLREHLDVLRDMTRHIPDEHAASSVRGEIDQALREAS